MVVNTANAAMTCLQPDSEQDITIVIEDDAFIQKLNRDFLGVDAPTDVLSFLSDEIDPETNRKYLGDIIISFPQATTQAQKAGHPVESEIQLLIIHGILHLLGYDHDTARSKKKMWQIQQQLIESIGIKINQLPEE